MKKADVDNVIQQWQEAFRLAWGKEPPEITCERGWFRVGFSKYRKKQIIEFTGNLNAQVERRKDAKV